MNDNDDDDNSSNNNNGTIDPIIENDSNIIRGERRHRIAMVCDFFHPNLGGVENHIWSLSYHLIRLGHKVIIITHGYNNRKGVRYLPGPLKVYHCPIQPIVSNTTMPSFFVSLPILRYILIRENINIVHAHQATSFMGNEAIVYGGIMGIHTVYTDHSLFALNDLAGTILSRLLQTTLSTVDAAICVSHTCRDNFILRTQIKERRQYNDNNKVLVPLSKRVRVIPNAVTSSRFTPADTMEKTTKLTKNTTKNDRIKVVVISRLVYRKGVDLLVGIIPNVCKQLSNVDFIIGGDGNKMLNIREMVEREHIQDRVTFLGSVPHSNVRNVLISGHVFLNCSLTESFCIAILEAASCGLLVVSTNVGGVPEVLPDDMILLSDPNIPSMVNTVIQAIQKQSSDNPVKPFIAHERVKNMYSWKRVAIEAVNVYDNIREQPPRTFHERIECYRSIGLISGYVACYIAIMIQLVYHFLEWLYPRIHIDQIPDLVNNFEIRTGNHNVKDYDCDNTATQNNNRKLQN